MACVHNSLENGGEFEPVNDQQGCELEEDKKSGYVQAPHPLPHSQLHPY